MVIYITNINVSLIKNMSYIYFKLPRTLKRACAWLRSPFFIPMILTVGIMGTRLQEIIPVRTVCIQKPDTNVRQTKTITWEDPKPTKNEW
jgi:hypothetical protein